jgi:protein disulfide-isomerase
MKSTLFFTLILLSSIAFAEPKAGWSEDYKGSLAKAKEEKKDVLLDFTGSDWCGWCIKLDKEVFSTDEFKQLAEKKLVLVELDYPRSKTLPDELKKQNSELKEKFGIRGYPTIILVNSRGKELKRWVGYSASMLAELKKEAR